MPRVNPEILVWARKTAGFTPEEAADGLGISDARGILAIDRLYELENGEVEPSRPVLLKMAKFYRRPLLLFYMSAPPRKGNRGQDFRTLPTDYSATDDALIDVLVRDVMARQDMVRSLLEDEDDAKPLEFVGSAKTSDGITRVVASIEDTLKIDYKDFYAQPTTDKAFALLRTKVEAVGIMVLLIGNLGSHHTAIRLEVFRGFALADKIAPFIIINDQDSHAAWSFTLLHELAHIWLGQSGISGRWAEKELEQFCNDVAGEFILPRNEIAQLQVNEATPLDDAQNLITQFANSRNLSSSMVAYKLYRYGSIEFGKWRALSNIFRERWLQGRDEKHKDKKDQDGGPSYYLIRRHRVGTALINFIDRMMTSGALTTTKAGKLLGVKAKNVQHLIEITRMP
jgi:Zn-dependent peptidase ImmA (M78 family)/transcriptional regulator with XRE-family HTH domain